MNFWPINLVLNSKQLAALSVALENMETMNPQIFHESDVPGMLAQVDAQTNKILEGWQPNQACLN